MAHYEITNTESGLVLGIYEGETPEQAIQAMLDDAGCTDAPDPALVAREADVFTSLLADAGMECVPRGDGTWKLREKE